jgi:glycine/D-amino acid oxidase-like deaminating enzyme
MYILPRGDGTFIVGGTRLPNDWDTEPRPETTREIIARALAAMPTLASQDGVGDEVEILGVNVGLRPARKDGVRLERGDAVDHVAVIHSYGYGGYGYQCSWGAAFEARNLIDEVLQKPRLPPQSTLASFT